MRVLAVVADVAVRDALLGAALEPVRLARLPGHPETRVIDTGSGTVVIVPAGTGPLQVACTAAVATSRLTPDIVLAVNLHNSSGIVIPGSVIVDGVDIAVAEHLVSVTLARLAGSERRTVTRAAVAVGAAAAAVAYARPLLVVEAASCDDVAGIARTLFSTDLRG